MVNFSVVELDKWKGAERSTFYNIIIIVIIMFVY